MKKLIFFLTLAVFFPAASYACEACEKAKQSKAAEHQAEAAKTGIKKCGRDKACPEGTKCDPDMNECMHKLVPSQSDADHMMEK